MAIVSGETTNNAAVGFTSLPIFKQIGVLVGLAASIALGVSVVLWSIEPTYRPLFSNLSNQDSSEVIDVLMRNNIQYKLSAGNGVILVSADSIHDARLKLAAEGLPKAQQGAMSMLGKDSGLGGSQFMQSARYKHAVAADLASTISSFRNVKSAKVHLAIPRRTSFLRDEQKASASVFVDVYSGKHLDSTEVASIIHLVASSVPNLESNAVTVVDQSGNLLTDGGRGDNMRVANRILNYRNQVEQTYSKKIQDLLAPIVGADRVKARVTAEIDFTASEQTRELFDPDGTVLRSEQSMQENRRSGAGGRGGIPGALSNQPPANAVAEAVTVQGDTATKKNGNQSSDLRKQFVKNYELDKTISHTRKQPGQIQRLTVAVLVDNKPTLAEDGTVTYEPISVKEIAQLTRLVKSAIGFNASRGDEVQIINSAFNRPAPIKELPEAKIWEQPWFWNTAKQVGGGLFILLLIFFVLRPLLKNLANNKVTAITADASGAPMLPNSNMMPAGAGGQAVAGAGQLAAGASFDQRLGVVQNMATGEPKRVAGIVKTWVDN